MYIPSSDVIVNIYVLYFDGVTTNNRFTNIFKDLKYYTVTNLYSTKTDKLTFVEPMNMLRSTVIFDTNIDEDGERFWCHSSSKWFEGEEWEELS